MISISHEKTTLSNGLDLIIHEDHSLPLVAVNVWYHVGSKDEEPGRTGFAHLFEHVMFEGSKNHNELFFNPLQKAGGSVNGSTTSDRTNYYENLPSEHLELALWLESDRMGFLLEALDQERLDLQRDVVKNERRQSYENRPYGMAHLLMQPMLYPSPHPYSWPVIGSQEDLDAASLDDIKAFFRSYYSPSNASLAIAGDIDPDAVKELVERYFGSIAPGTVPNRVQQMGSSVSGEVSLHLTDKVELPRLYLAYPGPPAFDGEEAALDVLSTVLSDGKSSRLYRSLVYEKQIARDVSVGNYAQEIAGEISIQATASPGHSLDEIQAVIEEELDRVRTEPPTDYEIQRAINRIESHHVRQIEQLGGFGGRADQLNYYNTFTGNPEAINTDIERYRAVTAEDIPVVAKKWLGANRVRLTVAPEPSTSATTSSLDRSIMPVGGSPSQFTPPTPRRERLANGVDLLYVEKRELPMVAMGLLLNSGADKDPVSVPGLVQMTTSMLTEGTSNRTSTQISEEMEFLGSGLHTDTGREHAFVSAEALTAHWPAALEVVADVVKNATFPADELERVRKERLADLKRMSTDPAAISQRVTRALMYGHSSGYGHPLSGTPASVADISRDDLEKHYGLHFAPENATLVVVGDIAGDELAAKANELLAGWGPASGDAPPSPAASAAKNESSTLYLVDRPGAPQSIIRAAHLTIPRSDPDFYAMYVINYVFGAQMTARLMTNLRQEKGYSYGYYSQIDWLKGPSSLIAGGSVQTAVTKDALAETLKEYADIRQDRPITEEEFKNAKDGILRGFPSQFETQGQILQQLGRVSIFGLPDNYYASFLGNIDALTLDDVRSVASNRIEADRLVVLVVGDREAISPGLSELGLPIVVVDNEGLPV
jgi:zinc protease